ncbi:pilus assembly protein N-terminal domain-containing protein [Phyllobacterium phragmitis]|uniref:pilus assembly protein N-terminal domain-containing protein n=1 Tax=Phyllobacterium phragmitis TaxID=2670329 RepID=UPI0038B386FC
MSYKGRYVFRGAIGGASLFLFALFAGAGGASADEGIKLVTNQARVLRLARPAETVVIGNPEIADAVVQDARTVVLTGKGFGVTNIVIMDADGTAIVDDQVVVGRDDTKTTRVYRRADVQMLSCTPFCEKAYQGDATLN